MAQRAATGTYPRLSATVSLPQPMTPPLITVPRPRLTALIRRVVRIKPLSKHEDWHGWTFIIYYWSGVLIQGVVMIADDQGWTVKDLPFRGMNKSPSFVSFIFGKWMLKVHRGPTLKGPQPPDPLPTNRLES